MKPKRFLNEEIGSAVSREKKKNTFTGERSEDGEGRESKER